MSWYLDSSAILKLIYKENETEALISHLSNSPATSSLARIEVIRVVQRNSPSDLALARRELAKMSFIPIGEAVIRIAESFAKAPSLRPLDAIHIASALLVQSSIQGILTYDATMSAVAKDFGLQVFSPQ